MITALSVFVIACILYGMYLVGYVQGLMATCEDSGILTGKDAIEFNRKERENEMKAKSTEEGVSGNISDDYDPIIHGSGSGISTERTITFVGSGESA